MPSERVERVRRAPQETRVEIRENSLALYRLMHPNAKNAFNAFQLR
jgi:hypothetical protein